MRILSAYLAGTFYKHCKVLLDTEFFINAIQFIRYKVKNKGEENYNETAKKLFDIAIAISADRHA